MAGIFPSLPPFLMALPNRPLIHSARAVPRCFSTTSSSNGLSSSGADVVWHGPGKQRVDGYAVERFAENDSGRIIGRVPARETGAANVSSNPYAFTDRSLPFSAQIVTYRVHPLILGDSDHRGTAREPGLAIFQRPDPSELKLLPVFPEPAPVRATVRALIPSGSCGRIIVRTESGEVLEEITRGGPDRCTWLLNTSKYDRGRYQIGLRVGSDTVTRPLFVFRGGSLCEFTTATELTNSIIPIHKSNEPPSIPS